MGHRALPITYFITSKTLRKRKGEKKKGKEGWRERRGKKRKKENDRKEIQTCFPLALLLTKVVN